LVYGIELYAHLARYEPAKAANRTDPLIGGYDLAKLPNEERSADSDRQSINARHPQAPALPMIRSNSVTAAPMTMSLERISSLADATRSSIS
jgi:hypothetical protein